LIGTKISYLEPLNGVMIANVQRLCGSWAPCILYTTHSSHFTHMTWPWLTYVGSCTGMKWNAVFVSKCAMCQNS